MRSRCDSTLASLHMSRCVTSDFDISRVKSATGTFLRTARLAATPRPSADLPMLGRAAITIRFPSWNPDVIRSRSRNPRRDPGDVRSRLVELRDPLEALLQQRLDVAELRGGLLLGELEEDLLGPVDELGGLSRALPAEAGDLAPDPDEPAERRSLLDDLRVVAGVRARRHERRELVDAHLAADVIELAALVQLVDERDRVDRLALRVERERGSIDPRVALPVVLAPVRGQNVAHGGDRRRRQHHRAEDRLLGVEILRRNLRLDDRRGPGSVRRHRTRL